MPWSETTPMRERLRFLRDYQREMFSFTELCARYGISRKTGYKLVARFVEEGLDGVSDRSRAPRSCPHRTEEALVDALLEIRRTHPTWARATSSRISRDTARKSAGPRRARSARSSVVTSGCIGP